MSYEIFDFINSKDGSTYDIQTSNKIFKDVIIDNKSIYNYNFIKIIEGNYVYFININQIISITFHQN